MLIFVLFIIIIFTIYIYDNYIYIYKITSTILGQIN